MPVPGQTDYSHRLLGFDLYMYSSLQHSHSDFCYRFERKVEAERVLKSLAYGGFLIEVWSTSYNTERLVAEYSGNPELKPPPLNGSLSMVDPEKQQVIRLDGLWEERSRPGHTVKITEVTMPPTGATSIEQVKVVYKHIGVHNKRAQSHPTQTTLKRFFKRFTKVDD